LTRIKAGVFVMNRRPPPLFFFFCPFRLTSINVADLGACHGFRAARGSSKNSMAWERIRKRPDDYRDANLQDYEGYAARFSWAEAQRLLDGLPGGGLNIAFEAIDRHVLAGRGGKLALRWLGRDGEVRDFTYAALRAEANRFANVLMRHGLQKGDRVYSLLGRTPALYSAALGTLKCGCVFSPLFSAFGPEPIKARMAIGEAKALVTSEALYRHKVEPVRRELGSLTQIFVTDCVSDPPAGTVRLEAALADASDSFETVRTAPEDMALVHFTSGTTGRPKGAVHVHEAVVAHHITGQLALDIHPDDIFWCTADPGWITGTSYGIISPLTNGATLLVDQAEFDAERWYRILEEEKVSVWYTAPTAIRLLMKLGANVAKRFDFSHLRFMASVGEPLNPEAVLWGVEAFGKPFHDNWWQTETGGIMIANYPSMDVKPGSMGRPLPGITAAVVARAESGGLREVTEPMTMGELALRPGWPSMMRGYLRDEARYRKCFQDGWYLTGDLVMRDADGYYWFVGRSDDVIKSAGHLIGPFEVESALMEHPAVAEVGVIGIPDPTAGEVVKAYVALKQGLAATDALRKELLGHARRRLGPAVAPKEIEFRDNLPKTRSGKIMRRLLKARELGLPEGDLSTLESEER
jgi:acetyl-CoA synthetase